MSNSYPKISVITIVLNGRNALQKTIDSVSGQTYPNIEYILIDGGSTDGTLEVIEHNVAEGWVAKYISEPDEGISDAFNRGVELASGEMLGFINCGDRYLPDTVEAVAAAMAEVPSGTCVHGNLVVKDVGGLQHWSPKRFSALWKYVDMPFFHPTLFVPRAVYNQIGVFDKGYRIAMDYDLVLRAMRNKIPFHYIGKDLAVFANDGISATRPYERYREGLRCQLGNGLSPLVCYPLYFVKIVYWWFKSRLIAGQNK